MSIADTERMRQMQEHILDLMRRVAELEAQVKRKTLTLPKDKP